MSASDEFLARVANITEAELDAISERAKTGQLTTEDQATVTAAMDVLGEVLPIWADLVGGIFPFAGIFEGVDVIAMFNEFLADSGFDARIPITPSFRTEPVPGVELGGKPRNPEADVLDAIDELVDWQLENGGWSMTTPTLIELIGPDAYVDTQARVFDEMFPLAGLGDLLRDLYRLAVWSASRGVEDAETGAERPQEALGDQIGPKVAQNRAERAAGHVPESGTGWDLGDGGQS